MLTYSFTSLYYIRAAELKEKGVSKYFKKSYREGDMESTEDLKAITGGNLPPKERENLQQKLKWSRSITLNGKQIVVVPFTLVDIRGELLDAINSALHDLTEFTCVRFKLREITELDFVQFKAGNKG